jgi:SAM-dependent MidA family methyltransferase
MTFADYMRIVLYDRLAGFYVAPGVPPATYGGHFLTSPEVHPAFGALLATWCFRSWRSNGSPRPWTVAELGPGTGALSAAFLAEARPHEAFYRALRYRLVELSPALRENQRSRLAPYVSKVAWWRQPPLSSFDGVVMGNEILDALPFHRLCNTAQGVVEQYVAIQDDALVEQSGPPSPPVQRMFEQLRTTPPPHGGFELSVAMAELITTWAQALRAGSLLLIDYGDTALNLWSTPRPHGTLSTYHRHRQGHDPFVLLGEQDITARVNFTVAERAAVSAGLSVHPLVSQSTLLRTLGWEQLAAGASGEDERGRLLSLVDPGGLGGFKVMTATVDRAASAG